MSTLLLLSNSPDRSVLEPLREHAVTPQCEEGYTRLRAMLDRVEAQLARGDARRAMQRLGSWAGVDSRPLGPRGVSLLVRAALDLGRADLALVHVMRARRQLPDPIETHQSELSIGPNGKWFRVGMEAPVSLERRPRLRRLIWALAQNECGLTPEDLFACVWPDRLTSRSVLCNRIDVALARLRALGLRDHLVREPGRIALHFFSAELARCFSAGLAPRPPFE